MVWDYVEACTHEFEPESPKFSLRWWFSLAELLRKWPVTDLAPMETDEIFYTDGQDIVVTLSTLQVRDRFYSLKNIKKHSMAILQPARLPGIILFILGVAMALC